VKKFALIMAILACASVAYADDPIASTVRNRAVRKARRQRATYARNAKESREKVDDERREAIARRRVMEDQAHAANVQNAINGATANAVQAQSNAIQAQRNAVIAENSRAIQRAAGIAVCANCGATGHYACGQLQKSKAVLEYEAWLAGMIP
jgi:hypothetical protein